MNDYAGGGGGGGRGVGLLGRSRRTLIDSYKGEKSLLVMPLPKQYLDKGREFRPKIDTPLTKLYETTQKNRGYFEDECHVQVVKMWECNWHQERTSQTVARQFGNTVSDARREGVHDDNTTIKREHFQQCAMDTDSLYLCFSKPTIAKVVKPELRSKFYRVQKMAPS